MQNTLENTALVLFRVGPVRCCAPAQPIQSIVSPPKLTRTPGATEARPGIFHHNDSVVQVSDLRIRFGVIEAMRKQPGRLIITQQENGLMAFWVDEITEVIQSPKQGWGKLPAYFPKGIFSQTLLLENEIHLYVEIEKLDELPDENYLSAYLKQFEPEESAEENQTEPDQADEAGKSSEPVNSELTASEAAESETLKTTTDTEIPATQTSKSELAASSSSESKGEPQEASNEIGTTTGTDDADKETISTDTTASETSRTDTVTDTITVNQSDSSGKPDSTWQDTTSLPESDTHTEVINDEQTDNTSPEPAPETTTPLSHAGQIAADSEAGPDITDTYATTQQMSESASDQQPPAGPTEEVVKTTEQPASPLNASQEEQTRDETPIAASTTEVETDTDDTSSTNKQSTYELHQNHELIPPEKKATTQDGSNTALWASLAAVLLVGIAGLGYLFLWPTTPGSITGSETPGLSSTPTTVVQIDDDSTDSNKLYHAEIKQDDKGITIEIEAPADEDVLHTPTDTGEDDAVTTKQTETDQVETNNTNNNPDINDKTATVKESETETRTGQRESATDDITPVKQPAQKDQTKSKKKTIVREVIHIVVKGDTLWDIAQHYVKDPFRYPELAKLSNIKDPDRIYPGNRVRIIHKSKGK